MSGGYFDYKQYRIEEIAEEIKNLIETNDTTEKDSFGYEKGAHFTPETIKRFKEAYATLKTAAAMARRVDWLVSGDDGEESFLLRWQEDLEELNKEEGD